MKTRLPVLTLSLLSCLAAAADNPVADASQIEGFRLVVDSSLAELANTPQRPALEAWLRYAATRARTYDELARQGRINKAAEDYEIELAARKTLATFWAAQQESNPARSDPYLDKLVATDKAGFLEEYVLYFFVQPGWTVSGTSLAQIDLEEFVTWGNANLGGMEHPTLATLESTLHERPQASSQPGAALPDPAQYALSSAACVASREALVAAGLQWTEESKLLDGAPVAAADKNEFLVVTMRQRNAEPFRSEGMAWVADRPGRLTHAAGFCAVEAEDLLDAEWWLRKAASMRPLDVGIQAELVHVLISERRLREADALIDQTMGVTESPCDLAGLWRRRGYIRFEEGRLEESRTAYLKSLEYDPGNSLALSELRLLDQSLPKSDQVAEPPPAPGNYTTIQTCENQ